MADPTFTSGIAAALESAINAALRLDPGSRLAFGRLAGRVLAVESTSPSLTLYLLPQSGGLRVMSHYEAIVETRLKGSPLALVSLFRTERLSLADSGVDVLGSTALLVEVQKIIHQLDIDWEEGLSRAFGDVAGHEGAKAFRAASEWVRGRQSTFERLLGEYLSEELKATPPRAELQHFFTEVDELRLATDRLSARIQALQKSHEPS